MREIEPRDDQRLLSRPLAWAWVYGLVYGGMFAVVFSGARVSLVVRLLALFVAFVMLMLTARGSFAKWMAPADRVIVGDP